MADKTKIEWSDATWNPVNGCSVHSPGCTNCYAMKQAHRFPPRQGLTRHSKGGMVWTGEVRFNDKVLDQPLRWRRPRMIFVCAHGDLFHESVPDAWIDRVFAVMALCPQHSFQVLTKRSARMREYLSHPETRLRIAEQTTRFIGDRNSKLVSRVHWGLTRREGALQGRWPLPNVWLGVSVEDQQRADERIPDLLATPAAIRWLSCEPLLGPVDIARWLATALVQCKVCGDSFWLHHADPCDHRHGGGWTLACPSCGDCRCRPGWTPAGARQLDMQPPRDWIERKVGRFTEVHPTIALSSALDWIVCGGESGPGARPMHPDWARSLRDQCRAAGVPFFFKQWGEYFPHGEIDADGNQNSRTRGEKPGFWHEWRDAPGFSVRIGKKRAGRLLDGVTHDAMPALGGEAGG